ncbi:MAG: prolyl oligopeptidase family serine peptidase [Spirochaetales bacterium]|nr:prolyl oligopeptidase family serine peptidase [Spirochaetales bacterium]
MKSFCLTLLLILVMCQTRQSPVPERVLSLEILHDGLPRRVLLHVPTHKTSTARPLVMVLHGGSGTPENMIRLTRNRFGELADRDGFVVAYPAGYERFWHDLRADGQGRAHVRGIDDVGFLRRLITLAVTKYQVDPRRVFITGISNGGFMSLRAACEMSDVVHGVAAVTAQMPVGSRESCRPVRPISVLFVNGTEDPLVPYDGGSVRVFGFDRGRILSTDESLAFWKEQADCQGAPVQRLLADFDPADQTRVEEISQSCRAGVRLTLLRIIGGGHTWPGGIPYLSERRVGRVSKDIDAAAVIWEWFQSLP